MTEQESYLFIPYDKIYDSQSSYSPGFAYTYNTYV